ncbi:MAG: dihydropteroate synthase [Gorillibacterium sp.]|nr:dihydropteroate synthase [Gorillibacterium sp.]
MVGKRELRTLNCRGLTLKMGAGTLIMGILNVTPDSFSDGGRFTTVEAAVQQAKAMVAEGADLIDIGGESTRPGAAFVSEREELSRVIPVIEALKREVHVPLSIDTYKSTTAQKALEAGAHIINDIWGCRKDPEMAKVAAAFDCPIILMHNRPDMDYIDFAFDVAADLMESIKIAQAAGVRQEQIMLDPGIGFAKTYEHNLQLLGSLNILTELGYPVLLAASRKRTLRHVLGGQAEDVLEGTLTTTALGVYQGCAMVRVHDVKENKRAAMMADAIMNFQGYQ